MRTLLNGTNVDPADGDYPNGRTRDKVGGTPGTIINELLTGDFTQFFQKLIIDAATVENNLPDNVTNGYQLIEALDSRFNKKIVVSVGIWDMLNNSQRRFDLPAGIDPLKINSIKAMIWDDDTISESSNRSIKSLESGISTGETLGTVSVAWLTTKWEVVLNRWPGFAGGFDTAEYQNNTDNRGRVTIEYDN